MIKELKNLLDNHDQKTVKYLEDNKTILFNNLSVGNVIPKGIVEYLDKNLNKRQAIVNAIDKIEAIDNPVTNG